MLANSSMLTNSSSPRSSAPTLIPPGPHRSPHALHASMRCAGPTSVCASGAVLGDKYAATSAPAAVGMQRPPTILAQWTRRATARVVRAVSSTLRTHHGAFELAVPAGIWLVSSLRCAPWSTAVEQLLVKLVSHGSLTKGIAATATATKRFGRLQARVLTPTVKRGAVALASITGAIAAARETRTGASGGQSARTSEPSTATRLHEMRRTLSVAEASALAAMSQRRARMANVVGRMKRPK